MSEEIPFFSSSRRSIRSIKEFDVALTLSCGEKTFDEYKDYKNACLNSDFIFTTFDKSKAYFKCRKPVFDRKFFKTSEGGQFYISDGNISYKTVKSFVGERPWSMKNWKAVYDVPPPVIKDLKVFE